MNQHNMEINFKDLSSVDWEYLESLVTKFPLTLSQMTVIDRWLTGDIILSRVTFMEYLDRIWDSNVNLPNPSPDVHFPDDWKGNPLRFPAT